MKVLVFVGASLLLAACSATGQGAAPAMHSAAPAMHAAAPAQPESPAQAESAAQEGEGETAGGETLRCINEPIVGSRMVRRVCGTEAQWDRIHRGAREVGEDIQRMPIPTRVN